jgi:hypothetical protein
VLLLATACGGEAGEGPAVSPPTAAEPATALEAPTRAGATEAPESAPRAMPAAGESVVEVSDDLVTVLANRAPRIAVLRKLESATGFELRVGRLSGAESAPVTVRAVGVPLGEALVRILEGADFQLGYTADAEHGGHLLTRVAVGESRRGGRPLDREARREAARARREESPDRIASAERRREIAQRSEERAALASRQVDDPDPRVRSDAVAWLDVDREGVERLGNLLATDPAPAVRAAAAERLSDADSHGAVTQLLTALADPDSQVVIAALDALEWVGDESIIPQLGPLLKHPDPAVRERTVEAIEFLE